MQVLIGDVMLPKRAGKFDRHIADQVRSFRLKAGMTQSDLADKLGISFQQIQKYEKCTNRVCAGRLFEIARVFGVPVHAFFPTPAEFAADDWERSEDDREFSEFVFSLQGRNLCQNYLRLPQHQRHAVLRLIRELSGDDC